MENELIRYVDVDNPLFKNRSMKLTDVITKQTTEIPIPDDHIICDLCNWNIMLDNPKKIALLVTLDGYVKKALCQKCVDKYYPNTIYTGKSTN